MFLLTRFRHTLRFIGAYAAANIQAAMEYRISFWVQVLTMVANDSLWLFFWWTYFQQFPVVHGWQNSDIVVIWAEAACAFGISAGFFGNASRLATLIMNGGLDAYLGMPRNVLLHVCISASDPTAWGDIIFALGAFLLFLRPDPLHFGLFLLLTMAGSPASSIFGCPVALALGRNKMAARGQETPGNYAHSQFDSRTIGRASIEFPDTSNGVSIRWLKTYRCCIRLLLSHGESLSC